MNKRHVLTAAILGIGGIGLMALPASAQDANQPAGSSSQAPSSAGGASAQPSAADASSAQTAGARSGTASASQADVQKALSQTAQAVLQKGGLQSLSQQISQRDQQKLGDLSQSGQQLDQTVDQLKQAFKDKYQKDLDLSQNAEQIFTAQFIQMGAGSDQARQASSQQPADSTASSTGGSSSGGAASSAGGAAGSSGAAASSTGDAAQTASASSGGMTTITIAESHGMPAARVNLVNEGGQWKIQLPAGAADAKQLTQNLQQQLQKCQSMKSEWPADATQGQQAIVHSILLAFSDQSAAGAGGANSGAGTNAGSSGTSGLGSGTSGTSNSGTSATPTPGASGTSR